MDVRDATAIVTGAGGDGSGRAIACRFAREGAAVVVCDVNEGGARATVERIAGEGGRAVVDTTDVRSDDSCRDLIARAEKTFGPLRVLVNNASAPYHPEDRLEYWRETVETDLLGPIFLTRHAIDAMRAHGRGGAIVNMTSISSLPYGGDVMADVAAYDAAKGGLMRLTCGLWWLAQSDRIRLNCLAPGWIASTGPREYWESLSPDERKAQVVPSRLLPLDDVADAVYRLATDERLAGRVMVWHSEDVPRLITFGDRGYESLERYDPA
ncbi:MAG TPA: SDR family oxidoreductase [Candidatus Eremiobacteraceae bacterium]|nr:SDR family oxidoreductase [Candidatus Eremiobacteraceae bacterium]